MARAAVHRFLVFIVLVVCSTRDQASGDELGDLQALAAHYHRVFLPPGENTGYRDLETFNVNRLIWYRDIIGTWENRRGDIHAELITYCADRLMDEAFSARFFAILQTSTAGPAVQELRQAVDSQRVLEQSAETISYRDLPRELIQRLIEQIPLAQKRAAIEQQLAAILQAMRAGNAAPLTRTVALIKDDILERLRSATTKRVAENDLLASMREGYWRAFDAPTSVDQVFKRNERLLESLLETRGKLHLSVFAPEWPPKRWIKEDSVLREFVSRLQAYDTGIIAIMQLSEVKSSEDLAIALDGLYDAQSIFTRRTNFLKSGRFGSARAALDALLLLGRGYVAGREFEGAPHAKIRALARETDIAKRTLAKLERYGEAWRQSGTMRRLYVVVPIDSAVRESQWRIGGWLWLDWLDDNDLAGLRSGGRIVEAAGDGAPLLRADRTEAPTRQIIAVFDPTGL